MKKFKIYNTSYPLKEATTEVPDAFAINNELIDDPPNKGKKVGYVVMEDGSVIECYTGFNPVVVVVPLVFILVVATGVFVYFYVLGKQLPKIPSLPVSKTDVTDGEMVVSYNGFMAIRDGALSVNYQNGAEEAVITVEADGVEVDPVTVEPNGSVDSIPATYKTKEGVLPGTLTIKTPTTSTNQDIVIEIPDNNTANSPEGLEGYWKGEYVYGTGDTEPKSE